MYVRIARGQIARRVKQCFVITTDRLHPTINAENFAMTLTSEFQTVSRQSNH